jgi:hypothetical protein
MALVEEALHSTALRNVFLQNTTLRVKMDSLAVRREEGKGKVLSFEFKPKGF